MTVSLDLLLEKANRKLNDKNLDKDVASKTREVIKEMYKAGVFVGVSAGYRSNAEQDELYKQGRTKAGAIVTNAKGGESNHNFGVAVDLFQYSKDGTEAIFENDSAFQKIVKAMKKKGFDWGGDWRSFKDTPHFQLYDAVSGESKPKSDSSGSKTPTPKPSTGSTHKIVKGDTLSEIAKKYNVSVEDLQKWNGLKDTTIVAGKSLKVKKPTVKQETVKVKIGDTLNGIASKHGLKLDQLLKLNPSIKNPNSIYPDQKIRVK